MKSLAVIYRPKTWDDLVEQDAIKVILKQQLDSGSVHSAMLFCGPSGDGKTTTARIFASMLNKGKGVPIEMDAASHNGVDDVREIVKMASTKAVDADYKVFIIDECFPAQTVISTPEGNRSIGFIRTGDYVNSMSGIKKVTNVFKNSVLTSRLCRVNVGSRSIITTVDHLFFTNNGWVKAIDLQKGDILYANNVSKEVFELWQGVPGSKQPQRGQVLLSSLFSGVSKENSCSYNKRSEVSDLWESYDFAELFKEENLFSKLSGQTNFQVRKDDYEYRIRGPITETILRKNVKAQSNEQSRCDSENGEYKGKEQHFEQGLGDEQRWKWEIHYTADSLIRSIKEWMDIRVSDKNILSEERTSVSYLLQSRPRLSPNESCSRGGWQRSQIEAKLIEGCKENRVLDTVGVESVEVYKRGYNDELFRRCFTDTELSGEYVTMYDLEVEDDHAYFASGVLVHNCHSISNTGWQAFLKCIEEPPARVVFIFCTTDPQKIPATILSRVQRYQFQKISTKGIADRLDYILSSEMDDDMTADRDAIEYIAKLSNGGMRLAIQYLEKCMAYSKDITVNNVVKALNVTNYNDFIGLTNLMFDPSDRASLIMRLDEIYASGVDFKQFLKQYLSFILDVNEALILDDLDDTFKYTDLPKTSEVETWLTHVLENGDVNSYNKLLSHLVKLDADVKYSQNPKVDIECGFLLFEV